MFPYRYPAGKAMSLLLMCENWKKNDITAQCMIERRDKDSFKCLDSSQFCLQAVRVGFLVQKVVTFQMYVQVFMRPVYIKKKYKVIENTHFLTHTLLPKWLKLGADPCFARFFLVEEGRRKKKQKREREKKYFKR